MIYLDSAALVKLVRPEAETAALRTWLAARRELPCISSVVAEVEVGRAVRRSAPDCLHRVTEVLSSVSLIELAPSVRARAAAYDAPDLRSLDAIHIATAQEAQSVEESPLEAFVTYDQRLLGAAAALGLAAACIS